MSRCKCEPKFDRTLKRLVTERDARAVRKHGRLTDTFRTAHGTVRRYRYKGATFHEFIKLDDWL